MAAKLAGSAAVAVQPDGTCSVALTSLIVVSPVLVMVAVAVVWRAGGQRRLGVRARHGAGHRTLTVGLAELTEHDLDGPRPGPW